MESWIKELMIWFIGADVTVREEKLNISRDVKLSKAKSGEATRREIRKFLRGLNYLPPYKPPSIRAVYKWLKELEKEGFIHVKGKAPTDGRPNDILALTEIGLRRRILINEKFKAAQLVKPSDIMFTMAPNREYLTVHAVITDPKLIGLVWSKIDEVTREREKPMRGRSVGDVFFKGHPIFKNLGTAIFGFIIGYLSMRETTIPSEASEQVLDMISHIPELHSFFRSNDL